MFEEENLPIMKLMAKNLVKFWSPPLVWAAVIFLFSSITTASTSEIYWQDFIVKKLAHIVEYGIFAVLIYRALLGTNHKKSTAAFLSVLIAILYGATDEYHQSFTPGREPRARDVVFDTIGAGIFVWWIWKSLPKTPPKLKDLAKRLDLL